METHIKTKLCSDHLMKILWPDTHSNPPLYPFGTVGQCSVLQCSWQHYRRQSSQMMGIEQIWKCKGHGIAKTALNKNRVGGFILFAFMFYCKAVAFKRVCCWHTNRHIDQRNQTESRNRLTYTLYWFLTKVPRQSRRERKVQHMVLDQLGKHGKQWISTLFILITCI